MKPDTIERTCIAAIIGLAVFSMLSAAGIITINPVGDVWQAMLELCQATCGG